MIKILKTKSGVTKFQVLIEIAAHQPNVRQKEIAAKIGITPQAVDELPNHQSNNDMFRQRSEARRKGLI